MILASVSERAASMHNPFGLAQRLLEIVRRRQGPARFGEEQQFGECLRLLELRV